MRTAKKIALFSGVTNPSFELDLDNVATDFTFTRASSATYVDVNGTIQTVTPTLGSELSTNGGFDTDTGWTKESGWTISDGTANATNATNTFIYQNASVVVGKEYELTYTITEYTSGEVKCCINGGGNTFGTGRTSVGTYTERLTAHALANGNASLAAFSSLNAKIDNFSVKEVIYDDVPRIDYSDATFDVPVYADLITNGDFVTDTIWTYDPSYTISGGVASYDGVSSGINIKQADADLSEPLKANTDYTLQFTISNSVAEARLFILDHSGSKVFVATANYADGTHVINFTTPADIGIGGIAFYTYNVSGGDAFDIDDISLTGVSSYTTTDEPALLLEPASTNLITYSEDFSDASWLLYNGTTKTGVSGVTAPDGTTNAYGIALGAAGGNFNSSAAIYKQYSHTDTVYYTFSCYIRSLSGSETVRIGMSLGTSYDTGDTSINETWQRLEVTGVATSTAVGNVSIREKSAGGGTNIIIWGAQLEALSYPTSYIKTEGATATRATELCVDGGSADVINSEEGSLIIEMAALDDDGTYRYTSLSDGTGTNRIYIGYKNDGDMEISIYNGAVSMSYTATLTNTNYNKIGLKYKEDDFAVWINGTEVHTDSSGTTYSADTLDRFNFGTQSGASPLYGKVKSLQIYKEALSDSDLESKTT